MPVHLTPSVRVRREISDDAPQIALVTIAKRINADIECNMETITATRAFFLEPMINLFLCLLADSHDTNPSLLSVLPVT
jgi:hypothetical protein